MVQINGWLEIIPTYLNEDIHTEIDEEAINSQVDDIIANLEYNDIQIISKNGFKVINFFLNTNHKTEEAEEMLQTFEKIAKVATGSYGLLYVWDEYEDADNFRILVARKGVVEWKKDEFFSPNSEMIYEN
jgi:hypothetical protein